MALCAAQGNAETRHDFIKNQDHAVFGAELTNAFEKACYGWNAVHISSHRFDNDAGDLITQLIQCFGDLFQIVIRQGQCVLGQTSRYTG